VPNHPTRSRRSRLLVPLGLAVVTFIGIGSVAAGMSPAPTVILDGQVAGAWDVATGVAPLMPASPEVTTVGAPGTGPVPLSISAIPDAGVALPGGAPPVTALTGYRWPIPRPRITLPFGPTPWGDWIVDGVATHDGIDLATFCGDRVRAAHDGTVLAAGRHFDGTLGWVGDLAPYYARLDKKKLWTTLPIVVVIDDGNGYRSVYAHFGKIVVKKGQTVKAGSLLGYEGRTGHASGCHLHYGLFSPFARAVFTLDPAVARRMKLPPAEIARVDPRLVLPPWARPAAPSKPKATAAAPVR
jgi:murein DD-endopeptidase MepM/ murein hydrolase activator NlpD